MIRYSYKEITERDGYGSAGFSISAFDGTSNIGSMIVMWQSTNACRLPEPELKEAAKRNVFATIQVCSKEFFSDIPVVMLLRNIEDRELHPSCWGKHRNSQR